MVDGKARPWGFPVILTAALDFTKYTTMEILTYTLYAVEYYGLCLHSMHSMCYYFLVVAVNKFYRVVILVARSYTLLTRPTVEGHSIIYKTCIDSTYSGPEYRKLSAAALWRFVSFSEPIDLLSAHV